MQAEESVYRIRIWQWPNILALDAAGIAVGWQSTVSKLIGQPEFTAASLILGLSVWLTYVADRLFDVRSRDSTALLSARHQFAKLHAKALWRIWWLVLFANITLAFALLDRSQLSDGFMLLGVCLGYTTANQRLSKRFFPKELFVAGIFAGGVIIFIPSAQEWTLMVHLSTLYLINCLLISKREQTVDQALRVRSIASTSHHPFTLGITFAAYLMSAYWLIPEQTDLVIGSTSSACSLALLFQIRSKLSVECYRVLCDTALLTGPISIAALQLF